jgi:pimeloyl-[acyl-carrier protein] methyl ester esterase
MLHVDVTGNGSPLLLIHGWGMHGGVWEDVAQKLAAEFRVHSVDLPGHGKSPWIKDQGTKIENWVDALSAQFTEPINVCGWSLGGQIALHWAAREPAKVRRLILVGSTPCFTRRKDWLFGIESDVLERFAAELEHNHVATLRRFIALQLRGSENERELLALMRERLFSRGEPEKDALRGGLEILREVDLRGELAEIRQPTLVIAGGRDKLTPPAASNYLAQVMPSARVVEVEGAAHAPFLSHPEIFIEQVKNFLHG